LGRLSERFSYSACIDRVRGFNGSDSTDAQKVCVSGVGGLSEADADGGSIDFGVFCVGDEYAKGFDGVVFLVRRAVSASTVSEVAKGLDGEVKRYHERRLSDGYRFLFFDGVGPQAEGSGQGSEKDHPLWLWDYLGGEERDDRLSLGHLGVTECLGRFFERSLCARCRGRVCEMITTDGGKGLVEALEVVYPRIPRQHCWAHKTRNVLDKVRRADQEKVKKDLHRVSYAKSRQLAIQAYWSFCQKYRKV